LKSGLNSIPTRPAENLKAAGWANYFATLWLPKEKVETNDEKPLAP